MLWARAIIWQRYFIPWWKKTGSIVFIGAIWAVAFLVNFLLTPLAGISTLVGPLAHIGELMGIDPYVVIFTFMQGMDQVLLPYENVMMLLFMSFGMLSMRDFVKYFGIRAVINLLFVLLILVPILASFLGIFAFVKGGDDHELSKYLSYRNDDL